MLGLILQIKELQWGWRDCTFSFSAAVGYNPNCCFGESEQSTATRAGVGWNYFAASEYIIYLFILC